jgi:multiple sugar transport system ATP-binding protein
VAGFIGSPSMNLCELSLDSGGVVSMGPERVEVRGALDGRSQVVIGLRPEALELGAEGIPAEVEVVEEFGADAYVFCTAQVHEGAGGRTRLVARTEAKAAPARGERVALRVRPGEAHVFDAESGARLGA